MSIEKIASKIEKDAKAAASKTIDAAKQEAWDVVDAANKEAEKNKKHTKNSDIKRRKNNDRNDEYGNQ